MANVSSSNGLEKRPKLRFPGFDEPWNTALLSDYFVKSTKKNSDGMISNVICNSAKQGLIPQREYFDKDIANSDNTNGYYIIESNDFVYNPRKSADAPYGPISSYQYPESGIVSPLYLCFRAKREINPLYFDGLKVAVTSDESRMINFDNNPKVIISASGMCEAGRIRHHLKHNLWKAESTVLFVGYQAVGTLGRAITEGAKEVKLFGESIQVKAHIEQLAGISGHADRDRLLEYAFSAAKGAKQVFVNHGNDLVTEDFAKLISEKLGVKTAAPYSGSIYDLDSGLCLAQGNTEYIEKPNKNNSFAASPAFDRLTEAGKKLQLIIGKNRGAANKDLAKFADQILAVCEKWDR